mgnify:CR=1 FL=1
MFKIEGKKNNNAICFASQIDEKALEQIQRMCDYDLTLDSKIRIMPDVHAGKGCTIGTTMTIKDKVCPNIVGVDIGCGMYVVKLFDHEIDFKKVDEVCTWIPSGMNTWDTPIETFDLMQLKCFSSLKKLSHLEKSLGTLGGGNHFIEIEQSIKGDYYLVIHSGSRNLGKQVAEIYQRSAIALHKGLDKNNRQKIIQEYKALGKCKEIEKTLKRLREDVHLEVPEDLCWLYGDRFEDYLHDIRICQNYAMRNRELIAKMILEKTGMKATSSFHTIHNYIDVDEMILRKGAIRALKGEMVLIPINMKDGSILGIGKGNPEWNYSAPHGAGRVLSRKQAKKELDLNVYKKSMEGIYTTSITLDTLDEAPQAYKPIEDILDHVKETVDVIEVLKPVYNYKEHENETRNNR